MAIRYIKCSFYWCFYNLYDAAFGSKLLRGEVMDELNEIIEGLIIDVAEEGAGTAAGIGLLWGLFLCGSYAVFTDLMNLLASMY